MQCTQFAYGRFTVFFKFVLHFECLFLLGDERGRLYPVSYMNLADHLDQTLQYYAVATFGLTTFTFFILFSISHLKFFIRRRLDKNTVMYSEPEKI